MGKKNITALCALLFLSFAAGLYAQDVSPETAIPAASPLEPAPALEVPTTPPPATAAAVATDAEVPAAAESELGAFIEETRDTIEVIDEKVTGRLSVFVRLGIAATFIILEVLIILLIRYLFTKLHTKVQDYGKTKLKPLKIKNFRLLETSQMLGAASFLVRVLKFLAMVISLYIAITSVFALFAPTRTLAQTLIGYVWNPLKNIIIGFIQYIPSLFMIAVTVFVTRYILRMVKFFSTQIQRGKLVISGFYADWAQPTYQILRVLIFALTAAVIYPLLPNSGSEAFKGISVFAGLLISFGSSSAISNMVAGIVLTYTRSFKVGDFIKLGDVTGFVEEKSGIVTRVRTPKNEYVTFPNTTVLNSAVTNYNTSLENDNGLVIHTELTEGYATPWKTVHQILIEAALKTQGVQQKPAPYVLQKALDDFYCRYEINAFTKDVERLARIYSELYQNIQDGYKAAGLDLTTPHIGVTRVQAETPGVTN